MKTILILAVAVGFMFGQPAVAGGAPTSTFTVGVTISETSPRAAQTTSVTLDVGGRKLVYTYVYY